MNDFDMICRDFKSGPVTVYPIADVHLGALEHQKREWAAFCDKIQKDKNAYIILAGDLINNNTRSSVGNPWDDVLRPREQKMLLPTETGRPQILKLRERPKGIEVIW